jgi:hypothetical protein
LTVLFLSPGGQPITENSNPRKETSSKVFHYGVADSGEKDMKENSCRNPGHAITSLSTQQLRVYWPDIIQG